MVVVDVMGGSEKVTLRDRGGGATSRMVSEALEGRREEDAEDRADDGREGARRVRREVEDDWVVRLREREGGAGTGSGEGVSDVSEGVSEEVSIGGDGDGTVMDLDRVIGEGETDGVARTDLRGRRTGMSDWLR